MTDLHDTLERLAAEGTRGAVPPPPSVIRRRRRNRALRRAAGATVLVVALAVATPVAWDALAPTGDGVVAPVTEGRDATPPRPEPTPRPATVDPDEPTSNADEQGAGDESGQGGGSQGSAGQAGPGSDPAAVASYFLRTELGMRQPVAAGQRTIDAATVEVDIHPRLAGEGGRATGGPITTVRLRREGGGWVVTGTRTPEIEVTSPKAGATVSSPVALRGMALAFEGTVQVKVLANRTGKDPELGRAVVTGGGDVKRPFRGEVAFKGGSGPGWLVFYTTSEADGQVLAATMVPVRLR